MEDIYYAIALITAGISLSMGLLSLGIARHQILYRTDLCLGIMGLSMSMFILIPPIGFITADVSPYSDLILIKRVFIFGYYAVFPWFLYYLSERPGRRLPQFISLFTAVSYLVMFYNTSNLPRPLWTYFSIALFGINFIYGFTATAWMFRKGNRTEARWISTVIAIYGVLFVMATTNHMFLSMKGVALFGLQRFFPIHMHSVAFMLIMGLRLQSIARKKLKLESKVNLLDTRWHSLIGSSPVIFMELDVQGQIRTINPFGLSQLSPNEKARLIGMSWFSLFAAAEEGSKMKIAFRESITSDKPLRFFKGVFKNDEGGSVTIDWVNFKTYGSLGEIDGVMMIGQDVTRQETTEGELHILKQEIEMESLASPDIRLNPLCNQLIGTSKALTYSLQKALQVAGTSATVLLEGETGVGKELIADLIHASSSRSEKPFIKVNCGALPAELIEDELFGHEKGSFTSAIQSRMGRFELANGGTIFLDEIGELPLTLQPKLLRVLQEMKFERIGGQHTIQVDVRVIAATNKDLAKEAKDGRFRNDLLYRLNVFPVTIPPLRNRMEDLDPLIDHFIKQDSKKYHKALEVISKADLKRLHDYSWPGNVRELKNVIERSVIQSEGTTLKIQPFLPEQENESTANSTLEQIERNHIIHVLEECNWKINGLRGAAERLDMHPNTLRSRMKKLDIYRSGRPSANPSATHDIS